MGIKILKTKENKILNLLGRSRFPQSTLDDSCYVSFFLRFMFEKADFLCSRSLDIVIFCLAKLTST